MSNPIAIFFRTDFVMILERFMALPLLLIFSPHSFYVIFCSRGSIIFSTVFEDHGELKDRRSTEAGVEIVLDGLVLKLLTKRAANYLDREYGKRIMENSS